jgi:DNA-3-methyladenine glycosylase
MAAEASVAAEGLPHARAHAREALSAVSVPEVSVAAKSTEPLPVEFYARPVVEVARELIGCIVEHRGCAGRIVETEAYHESEPACHAFVGVTPRTRTLFGEPGVAYVYRSYGIHALLNAVCEPFGVGAAVLIRALEPLEGIEEMRTRREEGRGRGPLADHDLCSGPGKLTQALGISVSENGTSLLGGPVKATPAKWDGEEAGDPSVGESGAWQASIVDGTRIGITKAVNLRWRFCARGNPHVSHPWPQV